MPEFNRRKFLIASAGAGAVSPNARDTERITPVRMPGRAAGRTTLEMVCHLVAPRPREASR